MKIIFISHFFYPHIGGVEKHVYELSLKLIESGHEVTVITKKYTDNIRDFEEINGINIFRFGYPNRKFFGLLFIWYLFWQKRDLFLRSDVVHIHDVFIWYLPFVFLFSNLPVFTTIHGLEWGNPFSKFGIWQKKLAVRFSKKTIGVGRFLEKYIGVKFDLIIYGAADVSRCSKKEKNSIVFVGRLSRDTGISKFLNWLEKNPGFKVSFVGDGEFRKKCEKYGHVYGFVSSSRFLRRSEYAVPGGYLASFEAMAARCKIKFFWVDSLKKDYWLMSPMYRIARSQEVNKALEWVKKHDWTKLSNDYLRLWE